MRSRICGQGCCKLGEGLDDLPVTVVLAAAGPEDELVASHQVQQLPHDRPRPPSPKDGGPRSGGQVSHADRSRDPGSPASQAPARWKSAAASSSPSFLASFASWAP
ncbi:hypothetical protein Y1Q_0014323 [Alligator mississippiensis]|uniref:Uncharacterized protein n=1 Tax=Alligator mississippiensis TaxID=8496 RepID=A0A151N1V4_ALLMI|nr:hypothetical protein Y1Q_0014323 [Alligator mississippiensis]